MIFMIGPSCCRGQETVIATGNERVLTLLPLICAFTVTYMSLIFSLSSLSLIVIFISPFFLQWVYIYFFLIECY